MSELTDRLDRFVRWFFNSSPTAMAIEPIEAVPAPKREAANRRPVEKAPAQGKRHDASRSRLQPQQRARA